MREQDKKGNKVLLSDNVIVYKVNASEYKNI